MGLAASVAVVAALGAVCRYLLDQTIQHRHRSVFPWGTFVINISGALLLGLFTGLAEHHGLSSSGLAVLGTGFCGGFTTFSTWMWETLALGESRAVARPRASAAFNAAGTLAVGLLAAWVGFLLALL
jgi:CrcB protein